MNNNILEAYSYLVTSVLAPSVGTRSGAAEPVIDDLERRLGFRLPSDLKAWLALCDGAPVEGQRLLGATGGEKDYGSIVAAMHEPWRELGWVPIVHDGCGNYYCLDCSDRHEPFYPVMFVEGSAPEEPSYIVASGLGRFLCGFLRSATGEDSEWPFDRASMLRNDPDLQRLRDLPFPWDDE